MLGNSPLYDIDLSFDVSPRNWKIVKGKTRTPGIYWNPIEEKHGRPYEINLSFDTVGCEFTAALYERGSAHRLVRSTKDKASDALRNLTVLSRLECGIRITLLGFDEVVEKESEDDGL